MKQNKAHPSISKVLTRERAKRVPTDFADIPEIWRLLGALTSDLLRIIQADQYLELHRFATKRVELGTSYLSSPDAHTYVLHSSGPLGKAPVTFTKVVQHEDVPTRLSFQHPHLLFFNICVLTRRDCALDGRVAPGKTKSEFIHTGGIGLEESRERGRSETCPNRRDDLGTPVSALGHAR